MSRSTTDLDQELPHGRTERRSPVLVQAEATELGQGRAAQPDRQDRARSGRLGVHLRQLGDPGLDGLPAAMVQTLTGQSAPQQEPAEIADVQQPAQLRVQQLLPR